MEVEGAKIESDDLKKCGDITTLLSIGKKEFFLNCAFCNYTFCQLDNFIQHICEEHMYQFNVPKVEDEDAELSLDFEEENVNFGEQKEYSTEDNEENNLRNFERVEIEYDETVMSESLDVKEVNNYDFMSDNKEESMNDSDNSNGFEPPDEDPHSNEDPEFAENIQLLGLGEKFNKKMLLAIFSSYEKRPVLWDAELQSSKYSRSREKEIKEIAYELKIPQQFETIRKLFGKLSSRLRTEMIRKKIYKSKGKTYLPAWHTDLNSFIKSKKPVTQIKPVQLVKKTPTPTIKPQLQESILNNTQCVLLADIYKGHPCLWDETDITYRFSNRRRDALKAIHEEFNEKSGLNLTQYDVESEIGRLRRICSTTKRHKITCRRQNIAYTPTCEYYEHIQYLEVNVSPFECPICSKIIAGACQYKVHVADHDGSLPFKCEVCGHGFKLATNLSVHLRRHVQEYMYKCEVCDKPCATTSEIKIHMRSHTGEKPYVCDVCGKNFPTSSKISAHKRRHENRHSHSCEICFKGFFSKALYREHMSVHFKVRDKICNICDKGFTTDKHLRQHKLIHADEKKYLCKICGKRFAQYAGLSGHMKSHGTTLALANNKNNYD